MKLKAVLIILAFTIVSAACGKTKYEYVQGQKGDDGRDGAGCTGVEIEASPQYPSGGVVISCDGSTPVVLKNGTKGADGEDGQAGADAVAAIIDPCGDAAGIYDEVILKLADGTLLASFSDKANGENTRFSVLTAGSYVTTDGSNCHFTVTAQGTIQ